MRTLSFTYLDRHYQASPLGGNRWSFTAYGYTVPETLDFDPVAEYGECPISWGQFIDELFMDLGHIEIGEYVRSDEAYREPCGIALWKHRSDYHNV